MDKSYGIVVNFDSEKEAQEAKELLNQLFQLDFYLGHDEDHLGDFSYWIAEGFANLDNAYHIFLELDKHYRSVELRSYADELVIH